MTAPQRLSAAASSAWAEITAGMSAAQTSGVDGPALEAYAVQVARMRDAQGRIDREGLVVADEKGRPVEHPAVKIEREAQAQVRHWVAVYRARPAGRARGRFSSL